MLPALVLLLVLIAVFGGVFVGHILFLLFVIALILIVVSRGRRVP